MEQLFFRFASWFRIITTNINSPLLWPLEADLSSIIFSISKALCELSSLVNSRHFVKSMSLNALVHGILFNQHEFK